MLEKNKLIEEAIKNAFEEDVGDGDHSSLACIPKKAQNKAKLIVKDSGVLAGIEIAELVFSIYGDFTFNKLIEDGAEVKPGDIAFEVEDILLEIKRLKKEGFKIINETPKKGADNKLICFIHPKSSSGVLIELCQEIK